MTFFGREGKTSYIWRLNKSLWGRFFQRYPTSAPFEEGGRRLVSPSLGTTNIKKTMSRQIKKSHGLYRAIKHTGSVLLLLLGISSLGEAQVEAWRNPLEFPLLLAGNFAELRPNHFHAGIDLKTQGATGKAIHAPKDGYVSRISASPWGYGYALYLNHPDGITTVYGHLERFAPKLAQYLWEQQHKQEKFAVNLFLPPGQFPVKEGEIVAYSGNTGSSGGPHVHFEMRETSTGKLLDALPYYRHLIEDTRPPKVSGILVSPQPGKGVVNGKSTSQEINVVTDKKGNAVVQTHIEAWGKVGLGIRANDYMDGTANVYGVKEIILKEGETEWFHSDIERLDFSDDRYINAWTDYEIWSRKRTFYQKCFREPGNRLPFIRCKCRGILTIDEEKEYHVLFVLRDSYGNQTDVKLTIKGKKQEIPAIDTSGTEHFHWNSSNLFGAKGIRLQIPKGNLYDDIHFKYAAREESGRLSAVHILHDKPVPLHKKAKLSLRITDDRIGDKSQYGIVHWKGQKASWKGGTYRQGWIDASISELGTYTVAADSIAPAITPVQPSQWMAKKTFTFRLADNLSGVANYRGTVDGKYVLFRMDSRSVVRCAFMQEGLSKGSHILRLEATDACGNRSEYEHPFTL